MKNKQPLFIAHLNKKNRTALNFLKEGLGQAGRPTHNQAVFEDMMKLSLEHLYMLGQQRMEQEALDEQTRINGSGEEVSSELEGSGSLVQVSSDANEGSVSDTEAGPGTTEKCLPIPERQDESTT